MIKRILLGLTLLAVIGGSSTLLEAQGWPCPGIKPGGQIGFGQQTAASDAAVALTIPAGVTFRPIEVAILNVSGANALRFRADGTSPTATVGHVLNQNDQLILCGAAIGSIEFVNDTAGANFEIEVHFYGG